MIFIPYNVPSSKNNRRNFRGISLYSKVAENYVKITKAMFLDNKQQFLSMLEGKSKPYIIGFHFIRQSKHQFDFTNAVEILADLMQKYEWLENDNMDNAIFVPIESVVEQGKYYSYDKNNPGVYIKVFDKMILE